MWQYWRCHSLWRTRHPGELKDMVTFPGGTTIEGCEALEKAGMRGAVIECINVSTEKLPFIIIVVILCRFMHRNYQTKEELSTVSRG